MTNRDDQPALEADEMIDGILAETEDPTSPVVTPFLELGNDESGATGDIAASFQQAGATDLWHVFRRAA